MTREKKLETALAETLDSLTKARQALAILRDAQRSRDGEVEEAEEAEERARAVLMAPLVEPDED